MSRRQLVTTPWFPVTVISDFEPFSAWWAWRKNVPFISIDHEHMLTLCKLEHPVQNWFSRLTASVITECHYIGAVAYVIIRGLPERPGRLSRRHSNGGLLTAKRVHVSEKEDAAVAAGQSV